jgi:hypothetical protein
MAAEDMHTAPGGAAGDLLSRLRLQETLPAYHTILTRACRYAAGDARLAGLCVSGSLARGAADRFSDLDLTVVVADDELEVAFAEHMMLLGAVGGVRYRAYDPAAPLWVRTLCEAASGPQEAAAPAMVVLDLLYVPLSGPLASQDLMRWVYLGPGHGHLLRLEEQPSPPVAALSGSDLRALDGYFWCWLHVLALRTARGEWWNVVEESTIHLRRNVLMRLMAARAGQPYARTRRVEQWLTPGLLDDLDATWTAARPGAIRGGLLAMAGLYRRLRDLSAAELDITFDREAEERILEVVHALPA